MKKLALLLALVSLLSLTSCGGSGDGSKEAADAIRKEAAQDGVNIDDVIANEQAEYEKQHEEYLEKAATKQEALEQIAPDVEAIFAVYDTLNNATGSDSVKAAEEYNSLITAFVEKWKDTDFKYLARDQLSYSGSSQSPRFTIPDTVLNLVTVFYDNVNISDYEYYIFYLNKNNPDNAYVSMQNGDIHNNDYHVLKMDGSIVSPDFSNMEDLPDKYVGFKDDKLYVPYLGFGSYPYLNWCFDLNGDGSGVGNSEEVAFEDMREKAYGRDELRKILVDLAVEYNSIYNLDIWN